MIDSRLSQIGLWLVLILGCHRIRAQTPDSAPPQRSPTTDSVRHPAEPPVVPEGAVDSSTIGLESPTSPFSEIPHPSTPTPAPVAVRIPPRGARELPDATQAAATTPILRPIARKSWLLLVDYADINAQPRISQRHLHQWPKQSNLCCVDIAWLPLGGPTGSFGGVSANGGALFQDLSDGTSATIWDLLLAGSWGTSQDAEGPWGRLDLGISTLVIARRSVGVDWGIGGSARLGWRFLFDQTTLIAGGAVDGRGYFHLDMHAVPAVTLFAGVEL